MKYVVVCAFIVGDYITGFLNAWKNHRIESSVMREGLFHKVALLLTMLLGVGCDYAQRYIDLGFTIPVSGAILTYIAIMEISSIIENIGSINEKLVPEKIRNIFHKLNGGWQNENEESN